MSKNLVPLPQITPPPGINSNAALLTDMERFAALNPKERLALQVWFRAKELASDTTLPLTNYDPAVTVKVMNLIQDAQTVLGNVPTGDLELASIAIDWANCKEVFGALPVDVDTLRASANIGLLADMPIDQLRRILIYLRLEIAS